MQCVWFPRLCIFKVNNPLIVEFSIDSMEERIDFFRLKSNKLSFKCWQQLESKIEGRSSLQKSPKIKLNCRSLFCLWVGLVSRYLLGVVRLLRYLFIFSVMSFQSQISKMLIRWWLRQLLSSATVGSSCDHVSKYSSAIE